ncbi:hypothetical protein CHISP_3280 [Chitinispirillum alkaliphilum]|nr:hypothetical protein CHISP_3280 [Chitinispirillum alkaliphilum]
MYFPTLTQSIAIANELRSSFPEHDVLVYGKAVDFQRAVADRQDNDIVIGPGETMAGLGIEGYTAVKNGSNQMKYLLASFEEVEVNSEIIVAVVNTIMDRTALRSFVAEVMGASPRSAVPTGKLEDLIPVLRSSASVKAIVISEFNKDEVMRLTQDELVIRELGQSAMPVAVGDKEKISEITKILSNYMKVFQGGVEWR